MAEYKIKLTPTNYWFHMLNHIPHLNYADDGFGNLYKVKIDKQMYNCSQWYENFPNQPEYIKDEGAL